MKAKQKDSQLQKGVLTDVITVKKSKDVFFNNLEKTFPVSYADVGKCGGGMLPPIKLILLDIIKEECVLLND